MNDSDFIFETIAQIQEGLRDILSAFGGEQASGPFHEALARVQGHAQKLGDPQALEAQVGPDQAHRLKGELESWMRLVALVATVAEREWETVNSQINTAQQGRKSLREMRDVSPPGASCNLSA